MAIQLTPQDAFRSASITTESSTGKTRSFLKTQLNTINRGSLLKYIQFINVFIHVQFITSKICFSGYQGFNEIAHGVGGPNPNGYGGGPGLAHASGFSGAGAGSFGGAWAGPGGVGTFNGPPPAIPGYGIPPPGFGSYGGGVRPGSFAGPLGGGGYGGGQAVGASSSASLGPQGGHGSAHIHPSQEGLDLRFGQPTGQDAGGSKSVFTSSSSGSSTVDGQTTSFKKATFTVNDNGNVTTYSVSDP